MTHELFPTEGRASPTEYVEALDSWLAAADHAGSMQRASTVSTYGHMWLAFTNWAVGTGVRLNAISVRDLETYLASRGGPDDLSPRYALRLLRLIDRVLSHHAREKSVPRNTAATQLIALRPDLRYADAHDARPLPVALDASEAKRLVLFLSAVRPGRGASPQRWQDIRNRASVGLMLGAGATPGDIRALKTTDVVVANGRTKNIPWKLNLEGNGNSPPRATPVASWAGQLLRYWLDVREEQGIPGDVLFPSTKSSGKVWAKVPQYKSALEVLQDAGIDEARGGSYRLRHTFALRQLKRGHPPAEVGRWLGVSDPSVMEQYLRMLPAPVDVA